MRLDSGLKTGWCAPETVLFGCPPGDELPPPRQQGAAFCRLCGGPGAWGRTHGVSNMRPGAGIEASRRGQWARRLGKVARLTGIHHHDRQARGRQRGDHGPLVSPRSFEPHELRSDLLESHDAGGEPLVIVGDYPAFCRGAESQSSLGFGDITATKPLGPQPHS